MGGGEEARGQQEGKRMHPSQHPKRQPVEILWTNEFKADAGNLLLPQELEALYLLLSYNPLSGEVVPNVPGLLCLRFSGTRIYYLVEANLQVIYLLTIEPDKPDKPEPPPPKEDIEKLKKLLKKIFGAGLVYGVKRAIDWLIDFFK